MKGSAINNYIKRTDGTGTVLGKPGCVVTLRIRNHIQERLHPILLAKPLNQTCVVLNFSNCRKAPAVHRTFSKCKTPGRNLEWPRKKYVFLILICLHEHKSLFFFKTTNRGSFYERVVGKMFAISPIELCKSFIAKFGSSCKLYILGLHAVTKMPVWWHSDRCNGSWNAMEYRDQMALSYELKCLAIWNHWQR